MSTKTVVKIKRKRDAEPTFSFVVASKRSKLSNDLITDTDSTSNDVNETVFHFVTTVNEHAVLKDEVSKKVKNAIALLPTEPQRCAISDGAEYKEEVVPDFLMEKIQKMNQEKQDILCNSVQMIREKLTLDNDTAKDDKYTEKDDDYVYDVYWCQNQNNFASWKIEDVIYLQPYQYIEEERSSTHSNYDDDDDSNDENNWRNDYPDELDSDSDNEERYYYYGGDGGYSRKSYYNDDDVDGCGTDEDYY